MIERRQGVDLRHRFAVHHSRGKINTNDDSANLIIAADFRGPGAKFHIGDSLQRHGVTGSGGHRQILNVGQIFAAFLSNGHTDGNLPVREREFRSEENTSELQSLMRISYAVFCLKKKKKNYDIE